MIARGARAIQPCENPSVSFRARHDSAANAR